MTPVKLLNKAKSIRQQMKRSDELSRLDQNEEHNKLYYENEKKLREVLKKLLDSRGLEKLNKPQLLELLDLCSTHRPIEPWQVLLKFSMVQDRINDKKENNK